MGARSGPSLGGLWFTITSLSFLVSSVLYWYVYLGNVPVWTNEPPGTGYLGNAAWLFTIKQNVGLDTKKPDGLQYGFGVWGWCEWDISQETGECNGKGAWSIPETAPDGDPVLDLDLPGSVKDSMFGCGVVLFIAAVIAVFLFLFHFATIRYEDDHHAPLFFFNQQNITKEERILPKTSGVNNTRARIARVLGWSKVLGPLLFLIAFVTTLPVLIVTTIAKSHYSDEDAYIAKFGKGFFATIAAIVLLLIGLLVIYSGGLWSRDGYHTRGDGTTYRDPKKMDL